MRDELPGHDKFCRHCGYDLYGLSENRCPECGNAFDPANPITFFPSAHTLSRRCWAKRIGILLSVLILLLGIGVFSLWYPWHREQPAVQMVHRYKGYALTKIIGPPWLQTLLGRRGGFLLGRVEKIYLNDSQVTDADLEHLRQLPRLDVLLLPNTRVSDAGLAHLKELRTLQELNLRNTQVTSAGLENLKGLTGLKKLYLDGTKVTDAGLEHLKGLTGLQDLELWHTEVTDVGLEHLKGLTGLQELWLMYTKVTDAGSVELRKALPGCRTYR